MITGVNYKIYEYVRHVFTALSSDSKRVYNTVEHEELKLTFFLVTETVILVVEYLPMIFPITIPSFSYY